MAVLINASLYGMQGLRGSIAGTIVRSERWVYEGLGDGCDGPGGIGDSHDCGYYQRRTVECLTLNVGGRNKYGSVWSYSSSTWSFEKLLE